MSLCIFLQATTSNTWCANRKRTELL